MPLASDEYQNNLPEEFNSHRVQCRFFMCNHTRSDIQMRTDKICLPAKLEFLSECYISH